MSIRFGLLGLLSRSSTHGYQLRTDFESVTGGTWPLNIGQVYTTLQRLERDGLIHPCATDDRKQTADRHQYELTPEGATQLHRWFAEPVPREEPPRSELVIKVALALQLPAVDTQAVIDVQRQASMQGLQALIRAKAAVAGDMAATLVADAAIFNAEAELRWLDHCESGLRSEKESRP